MNDILYCFISHQPFVEEDYLRISKMMKNLNYEHYIVVYGGSKNTNLNNTKIIHLNCADDYCSLPEKINKAFNYAYNNMQFNFLAKFDRTARIIKIFENNILNDYCGFIKRFKDNGEYHFDRCLQNHRWSNKQFVFPRIKYAMGHGYVLSKNSVYYVSIDDNYFDHVYEDVYVGSVMTQNKIKAKKFRFYTPDYFYDPEHPRTRYNKL